MALVYKMNEEGTAIVVNDKGLPVVVDDKDNKEMGLDAIHLYSKVPALQNELKQTKENLGTVSEKFKLFDGVENIAAFHKEATTAIETVKNLDAKKLVDAGEVEVIKRQAQENMQTKIDELTKSYNTKVEELTGRVADRDGTIFQLMVSDQFNSSKFVADKLNINSRVARKYFGDNFKVEVDDNGNRRVVGYIEGEKVYSKERAGELASFEEALEIMVDKDPDKESLLKGAGASGSGAQGSANFQGKAGNLQEQYAAALKSGNMQQAIAIKNRMHQGGAS